MRKGEDYDLAGWSVSSIEKTRFVHKTASSTIEQSQAQYVELGG